MGRSCTICIHPAYGAIDAAMEAGQPLREIAARYNISNTALHRHWHAAHTWGILPGSVEYRDIYESQAQIARKTIAKWVLITALGFGVLVWASRIPGKHTTANSSPPAT